MPAGTCSTAARSIGWCAWAGINDGLDPNDVAGHARLASSMQVSFGTRPDGGELVTLAGQDVTASVRSELAGQGASRVAAWPEVRGGAP